MTLALAERTNAFQGDEAVQLALRPLLCEEGGAKDDNAICRLREPFVDLLPQAVAELELGFI